MKSQEKLRRRIDNIFQSSIAKRAYHSGILQIQRLLIKEWVGKPTGKILYQLGFLFDHSALQEKHLKKRHKYEKQALALYRRALKLNPKDPFAIWGIGRIWWHKNRSSKALPYALRAYKAAREQKHDFGPFSQNIGIIYENMKKYRLAEKWYLRALKEERKKTVWSYANLIQLFKKLGRDLMAQQLARRMNVLFKKTTPEFQSSPSGKWLLDIISETLKRKRG